MMPQFACCQCDLQALILHDEQFIRTPIPFPVHMVLSHLSLCRPQWCLAQWSKLQAWVSQTQPTVSHFPAA